MKLETLEKANQLHAELAGALLARQHASRALTDKASTERAMSVLRMVTDAVDLGSSFARYLEDNAMAHLNNEIARLARELEAL